jgi:Spy/CpxP family protein refolding chaperone
VRSNRVLVVFRLAVASALIVLAPEMAGRQAPLAHRSKWWLEPEVQRELGLSVRQIDSLNQAFERELPKRASLRRTLDQLDAKLRHVIEVGDAEEGTVIQLSARVERIRTKRNVARTLMVFEMFRILTPAQRLQFPEIQKRYLEREAVTHP